MTYVKICGITNLEDAQAAVDAGADLVGFIFYPPSPRYVSFEQAKGIISAIRYSSSVKIVGVFVNESVEQIREIVEYCDLDLVQLSGDEPPEVARALSLHVYKSLRPRDETDARALAEKYRAVVNLNTPAFIIDSFNPKLFGGTGERADWTIARETAREFPILLAGGLTPANVAESIAFVQPWGVDVSSGVERAPGLKDHAKVSAFMEKVKR